MNFDFPEGSTPLNDISDLRLPWVRDMSDRNRAEAENILEAQRKYLRASKDLSWFQCNKLQAIHRFMFGRVWAWAGKIRTSVTNIGADPRLIPARMAEICQDVASWSSEPVELTFLEKSARIHHRLVSIHPFQDGNGRFSRLIADRCLLCWKCPHPIWPDDLHNAGLARKQYIETLKAADRGDFEPLILLMKSLGAADPTISVLLQDRYYRPFIEGSIGVAKIRALIRNGEDPNRETANGQRLLQLVINAKIDSGTKLALIKLLVDRGAEVNRADKSGLTPSQAAIAIGAKEIALFLRSK